ncbi:MAG: hypothetical protein ABIY90_10480 [Puia sp.]
MCKLIPASQIFPIFAKLKAIIAILFILLYSFSNTELAELVKLPVLIHHYLDHKKEHKDLTFFDFLKSHYASIHKAGSKAHEDHHSRLPFKNHDHNLLTGNTSIVPRVYAFLELPVYCETSSVSSMNEIAYHSHFLADIWQPPRA